MAPNDTIKCKTDANVENSSERSPLKNKSVSFKYTVAVNDTFYKDDPLSLTDDNEDEEKMRLSRKLDEKSVSDETTSTSSLSDLSYYSSASFSLYQSIAIFFTPFLLPFTDTLGAPRNICRGLISLAMIGALIGFWAPKNQNLEVVWYRYFSSIIGYTYFVCWSMCFYPQIVLNFRRKATTGVSNDFAILNFLGWVCYSTYVTPMYFDKETCEMYEKLFHETSTVQSNDVVFAIHAAVLSFIYIIQILIYNEFAFPLKSTTMTLLLIMVTPAVCVPMLLLCGVLEYNIWLDYFYMVSFFKICCTLTKYSKQTLHNHQRKSTNGWNIWYNFLEFTGGFLSLAQITLDSYMKGGRSGITGNLAKFLLGLATILFDGIFFVQHYFLYPKANTIEEKSINESVSGFSLRNVDISMVGDDKV